MMRTFNVQICSLRAEYGRKHTQCRKMHTYHVWSFFLHCWVTSRNLTTYVQNLGNDDQQSLNHPCHYHHLISVLGS
jgi:hypothetical protein